MTKLHLIFSVVLAGIVALPLPADDKTIPAPVPIKGKSPNLPPIPSPPINPVPPPAPDAPTLLPEGVELIVDYEMECVVESFPPTFLIITPRQVPAGKTWTLTGKFLDSRDASKIVQEDREFVGPSWVYRVRVSPEATGSGWLYVLPVGGRKSDGIKRLIDSGRGPQPPPKPDPPKPDPPKPDPNKVDAVWVIVVEDAVPPRTVELAKMLNDPYWQTLRPKNDWRHYLSTSKTAITNGYVTEAQKVGYPAVLILNRADGDLLRSFRFTSIQAVQEAVKAVTK